MFTRSLMKRGFLEGAEVRMASFMEKRKAALPPEYHQYLWDAVMSDDVSYVDRLMDAGADVEEIYELAYEHNAEKVLGYLDSMIKVALRRRAAEGDRLDGGLGDDMYPSDFCLRQVFEGVRVEMEHTDDPKLALEIALDHLVEDPKYYTHLNEMEEKYASTDPVEDAAAWALQDMAARDQGRGLSIHIAAKMFGVDTSEVARRVRALEQQESDWRDAMDTLRDEYMRPYTYDPDMDERA